MYESVSRVTGPWRAAFPENSHQDTLAKPTLGEVLSRFSTVRARSDSTPRPLRKEDGDV